MDTISATKPTELLATANAAATLFSLLRDWFEMEDSYTLDLSSVDAADEALSDPVAVIAFAMRKLQALRRAAQPGLKTHSDIVVTLVTELERVLHEVPLFLRRLDRSLPPTEAREAFSRCVRVVSEAGDAVGRLCLANHGAVVALE